VEPAGPTDPGIRFISVREPNGNMISIFSTYSLHYIGGVGNGDVSSDYYGEYCNRLLEMVGNKNSKTPFVAMMANGTSGDINNINFRTPRGRQMPYEQIQFVANDVATKVADVAKKLSYKSYVSLDARYREPLIGLRRPTPNDLAWATETLADKSKDPAKGNLSAIYAQRVNGMKDYPEQAPMPLQVLRIGNHTIGTMPCEVFCEIGLDYKNKTSQNTGWMVSLAHGYYGYLPTPRHHELGGYETWIGTNRLEKMASDKMLAQLFEMTAELKPGQSTDATEPARKRKLLGRKLFHR
jgi:neutral ceramidase